MRVMNQVLCPYFSNFAIVYFNDILVYSRTENEYLKHLRLILTTLKEHSLFANHKKCTWMTDNIIFLGYVVLAKGIQPDKAKVQAIQELASP